MLYLIFLHVLVTILYFFHIIKIYLIGGTICEKKECNNGIICPSTVNKLIDSNKDFIELNSNFPIRFKICDNISLPKNCKIEILETKLKYNISHIEKEILINGRSIESNSASLNDSINIGEDFINCPKSNINKILFSATEHLKLSICLTLIFKAIAHTDNYDRIYINL